MVMCGTQYPLNAPFFLQTVINNSGLSDQVNRAVPNSCHYTKYITDICIAGLIPK